MRKVKKVDEKQDEKRVILIIILGVIISLVALATSLKVLIDKNNKENNKAQVQSVEKISNIMDSIYKQLNTINNIADYIYTDKEVKFQNINEQVKVYSILKYLYYQNDYENIDEESYNRLFLSDTSDINQYKKINKKKIIKLYKEIYNKDIDNIKIDNLEDKCPNFKYDNDNYYLNMWCMENSKNTYYLYNTIREGNKVRVYVAVGKQVLKDNNKYQLMNSKFPDKVYKRNNIDSSNYKEFNKYEVYFHKKGDLFYLRRISKEGE